MAVAKYERVRSDDDVNHVHRSLHHQEKKSLLRRRWVVVVLVLLAIVAVPTLMKHGEDAKTHVNNGGSVRDEPGSKSETAEETRQRLFVENLQDRDIAKLSKGKPGFVNLNVERKRVRRKNKRDLDEVRFGYCATGSGNWHEGKGFKGLFVPSSLAYSNISYYGEVKHKYTAERYEIHIRRRSCEADHPRIKDARISIERFGPFHTRGGWNSNGAYVGGGMTHVTKDKTVYMLGRLIAPVYKNGTLLSYPPVNSHHAHSAPYDSHEMVKRNIPSRTAAFTRYSASNNILAAGYTDGLCHEDEGGKDCLLYQLEDGYGYRVVNSSGFHTYFEIGDLRPEGSPELEFYVDCIYIYTYKPRIETTWLHIGAPVVGLGWQTYIFPLDHHTNMVYFKYTNRFLGDGELRNFVMHAHMGFLDSLYVFKGIQAYNYLHKYTTVRNGLQPYIFECHNQKPDDAKEEILNALQALDGAELVCEGTKPGLVYQCDHSSKNPSCGFFPRRIELLCQERVRMLKDESLVVIAFNRIRTTSTSPVSRKSNPTKLAAYSPFGMGFAGHQHTVLRTDFTSDAAKKGLMKPGTGIADLDVKTGAYAPPTLFVRHLLSQGKDPRQMVHKCAANISFDLDAPTWFDLINWKSR